jgi:hypothetical protein
MKLSDIDEITLEKLGITWLHAYCEANGYEAHVSIQTHIEGLEKGEMKMFLQIVANGETIDHAVARLVTSAQIIGWNLYLHDVMSSARSHLDSANAKIDAVEGKDIELV